MDATATTTRPCPACHAPVLPGDRFCEACGRNLFTAGAVSRWLSSTAGPGPCLACGSTEIGAEGYCEHCGQRRPVGQERIELNLQTLGGATDRGRHKRHNEDALAIGRLGPVTVAVICDGVSSSTRADEAAHAAADTGMATILEALASGASPAAATEAAARAAAAAVAGLPGAAALHTPPSCTYVSAIATAADVTIGSVGDSRAYWLDAAADRSQRLTVDDSLAGRAAGLHDEPDGAADPHALALLRWLGADCGDTEPAVVVFLPPGPGHVLLCTDGLHRYLPAAADLAAAASDPPAETARALTQLAVDAGGVDKIAVAVLPFPPRDHSEDPGGQTR